MSSTEKWEFNQEVTDIFDEMLEKSIPQYSVMRKACFDVACKYIKHNTDFLDLGSSRGVAIDPFINKFGAYLRWFLIEKSPTMLEVLRLKFKGWESTGVMQIRDLSIGRDDLPPVQASVIQSILTIQFTPIEYRQKIIQEIYDRLIDGGAFIFVEKVLGSNSEINELMVDLYLSMKSEHGYSQDEIDRKRFALEGVLVPVTANWNEDLLRQAGFKKVDCFWRWMNFVGWVAIK